MKRSYYLLTHVQQRILAAVRDLTARHGRPPTYAELAAACEFASRHTAYYHVKRLVAFGYLRREAGVARSVACT